MNSSLAVGDQTVALGALARLPLAWGSAERLRGGEREEPVGSLQTVLLLQAHGSEDQGSGHLELGPLVR